MSVQKEHALNEFPDLSEDVSNPNTFFSTYFPFFNASHGSAIPQPCESFEMQDLSPFNLQNNNALDLNCG